ncbi:Crp/Fnr family transcriptional regulator [Devosia sp. RR2S18]|jgi:CRP-like cAMP-binding protein|uniref:Crp/Fnr family transcriptional regulator n=1 Tax=Devosia rhizosphaerae TaxID=3049774 RepID=UPI0025422CE9|nr:Crp/Fnr family transcriptional regulator [Devosia sp. RR2S18]WIJ25959.1 Crp/Fnr family transcriptional regulator [Devosia sp. RR2S18]
MNGTAADELYGVLQPFFNKLEARDALSEEEKRALVAAARQELKFSGGDDIVREGERPQRSMLLVSGFAIRYRVVAQGQRQILAIHIPGDFIDLQSFLLKEMDHSLAAVNGVRIYTYPHENLARLTESYSHLTRLLWLHTLLDAASQREWIVGLGRLSAVSRTAHLICEMYVRLKTNGLADALTFSFPMTQAALADALGLSTVHVNRVLQELRQRNLVSWEGTQIEVLDWDGLRHLGEFDDRYLHLVREPR